MWFKNRYTKRNTYSVQEQDGQNDNFPLSPDKLQQKQVKQDNKLNDDQISAIKNVIKEQFKDHIDINLFDLNNVKDPTTIKLPTNKTEFALVITKNNSFIEFLKHCTEGKHYLLFNDKASGYTFYRLHYLIAIHKLEQPNSALSDTDYIANVLFSGCEAQKSTESDNISSPKHKTKPNALVVIKNLLKLAK